MPKVLISGNGLDLSLGLPTNYSDFINILNHIQSEKVDFKEIYSLSKNYNLLDENFKKFDFDIDAIDELKKQLSNNLWFNFFRTEYQIDTWIDFENRIQYVLEILFESLKMIDDEIFKNGSLKRNPEFLKFEILNRKIDVFYVLHNFKIITGHSSYKFNINSEYFISKYQHFIGLDIDKIAVDLYKDLKKFKEIFNSYFEFFIYPFYDNLLNNNKLNLEYLSKFNYHYTFNYTPTFDKFSDNKNKTRYIHGQVTSDKKNLVLGISEVPESFVSSKYYIPFTKYYQRLQKLEDISFIREINKSTTPYYFYFLGHSLDKSDEEYIREVFDFTDNTTDNKIIIIYHSDKSKSQLYVNLLHILGKDKILKLRRKNQLNFFGLNSKDLEFSLDERLPVLNKRDIR